MKLGIMQPYLFPYIGYYQLINAVDLWVIFDNVQYIDKGWINRNRILHPNHEKEWQYFTIPLAKKKRFDRINEVSIHSEINWQSELRGKLSIYKKKAPFYTETMEIVERCLSEEEKNLSKFLGATLLKTAEVLEIKTKIIFIDDLDLKVDEIEHPGQWAVEISKALDASTYINLPAGHRIFKNKEFYLNNIDLLYLRSNLSAYRQFTDNFVPGLSIIDAMMWNSKDALMAMIKNDFELLAHEEMVSNER